MLDIIRKQAATDWVANGMRHVCAARVALPEPLVGLDRVATVQPIIVLTRNSHALEKFPFSSTLPITYGCVTVHVSTIGHHAILTLKRFYIPAHAVGIKENSIKLMKAAFHT